MKPLLIFIPMMLWSLLVQSQDGCWSSYYSAKEQKYSAINPELMPVSHTCAVKGYTSDHVDRCLTMTMGFSVGSIMALLSSNCCATTGTSLSLYLNQIAQQQPYQFLKDDLINIKKEH